MKFKIIDNGVFQPIEFILFVIVMVVVLSIIGGLVMIGVSLSEMYPDNWIFQEVQMPYWLIILLCIGNIIPRKGD